MSPNIQHMATLLFINLFNITELMIMAHGFKEFAIIVADSSLTEFELKCDFVITSRRYEESCTIVMCLSLYRFFIFQEKPNNSLSVSDTDLEYNES